MGVRFDFFILFNKMPFVQMMKGLRRNDVAM